MMVNCIKASEIDSLSWVSKRSRGSKPYVVVTLTTLENLKILSDKKLKKM